MLFQENSYFHHKIDGFKNCGIVCGHGAHKRCACKQALARGADPTASTDAQARADRAKIRAELVAPAKQAATAALATPTPLVWRRLLGAIDHRALDSLPEDASVATIQAAIAPS